MWGVRGISQRRLKKRDWNSEGMNSSHVRDRKKITKISYASWSSLEVRVYCKPRVHFLQVETSAWWCLSARNNPKQLAERVSRNLTEEKDKEKKKRKKRGSEFSQQWAHNTSILDGEAEGPDKQEKWNKIWGYFPQFPGDEGGTTQEDVQRWLST